MTAMTVEEARNILNSKNIDFGGISYAETKEDFVFWTGNGYSLNCTKKENGEHFMMRFSDYVIKEASGEVIFANRGGKD